ncbi:MAG TPA: hypothetical protein VI461_01145, partial [Chitinophagaceae bacterium]|nr:hypothetical protein [Chitinophagaceae bacterium]
MNFAEKYLKNPIPKQPGYIQEVPALRGSSTGLFLSNLTQEAGKPILLVTPDIETSTRLENELNFFLNRSSHYPILVFPEWETLPYDHFSPHPDIISERLKTLLQLTSLQRGIFIVTANALMNRIMPKSFVLGQSFIMKEGDVLQLDGFRNRLTTSGYRFVDQVFDHGEFSIRGSIVDVYPMGFDLPIRIELLDEDIDTIRTFDPDTQRSIEKISEINLLPAHEFPLTDEAITLFRQNWRSQFKPQSIDSDIYQNISQGMTASGIEYYLPLFFEKTESVLDYVSQNSLVIRLNDLNQSIDNALLEIKERYDQLSHDIYKPILTPAQTFLTKEEFFQKIKQWPQLQIQIESITKESLDISIDHHAQNPFLKLQTFVQNSQAKILFVSESLGRRESLLDLLQKANIKPKILNQWSEFINHDEPLTITIAPI